MTLRKILGAAALSAVLAGAGPTPAVRADTLADALVKAYANNPTLAIARGQLQGAEEQVFLERSAGLGRLDATSSYGAQTVDGTFASPDRSSADPFTAGVQGSLALYTGGQIRNGVASAEQGVLASRQDLVDQEQQVLLEAATAFEDVRRDIGFVDLARNNVRVINEQVRAAQDRFEVGEVTRTDVAQAQARLAAARSSLAQAIGALATSRQAYFAAVGEAPGDLEDPPPLPPLPDNLEAAVALADANHPQIQSSRFSARQAEFEIKREIGRRLPQVSLNGDAGYQNSAVFDNGGDQNSASVTLQATLPLWTGGNTPARIRTAQASFASAQAQVQNVARLIRQRTAVSWAQLDVARAQIVSSREAIRAARIAFEGVREEATLGARTTLDVLDAENELVSARADLVAALRDEYVAAFNLLASMGMLTVDHLGLNVAAYDPDAYPQAVAADPYEYPRDETTTWRSRWEP